MGKCILVLLLFFSMSLTSFGQRDSIAFLALGDSYTAGTSESLINGWPHQLAQILNKQKIPVKLPKIVAQPGWTTSDLLHNIESQNLEPKYGLVSLLIGVNNQYKGKPLDVFKSEFRALLETSIELAQGNPENVFVLTIPDWSVTPFARFKDKEKIVRELNTYNTIIEEETQKQKVQLIDITKISQNAAVNPSWIASDSLHPSKKMYRIWAKKITKDFFKD